MYKHITSSCSIIGHFNTHQYPVGHVHIPHTRYVEVNMSLMFSIYRSLFHSIFLYMPFSIFALAVFLISRSFRIEVLKKRIFSSEVFAFLSSDKVATRLTKDTTLIEWRRSSSSFQNGWHTIVYVLHYTEEPFFWSICFRISSNNGSWVYMLISVPCTIDSIN